MKSHISHDKCNIFGLQSCGKRRTDKLTKHLLPASTIKILLVNMRMRAQSPKDKVANDMMALYVGFPMPVLTTWKSAYTFWSRTYHPLMTGWQLLGCYTWCRWLSGCYYTWCWQPSGCYTWCWQLWGLHKTLWQRDNRDLDIMPALAGLIRSALASDLDVCPMSAQLQTSLLVLLLLMVGRRNGFWLYGATLAGHRPDNGSTVPGSRLKYFHNHH